MVLNNMEPKKRGRLLRTLIVVPVLLIIVFYYTTSMNKQMKKIKREVSGQMDIANGVRHQCAVVDKRGDVRWFAMGTPVSVAREVYFRDEIKTPNAFHLPTPRTSTLEVKNQLTGDVDRGGTCNVDVLSYVPHGLTHLETSAHVLGPKVQPPTVIDIPQEYFSGLVYLIDLSRLKAGPGDQIPAAAIKPTLEKNALPITMLAIKTRASRLSQHYDFSGEKFLSLSPEAAQLIHDYRFTAPPPSKGKNKEKKKIVSQIQGLIVDLPSLDAESDGGKLLAHRRFFGLPDTGTEAEDKEKRFAVELAWFEQLSEGYYYATITPPRFQTNAVSTGVMFHTLQEFE